MVRGLIGKKLGMTQVFDGAGNSVAVTVIQAGPCVVVQKKLVGEDPRVQLGFVEPGRKIRINRPAEGHFEKAGVPPAKPLKEFASLEVEGEEKALEVGDQVLVADVFAQGDFVDVSGRGKGQGFQGVVKRHGFHGGRATHGSMFHRAPGSIGASASPSRVLPGMKGPGRMGGEQVKIRKLRVVEVDSEKNILLVKGSVPGAPGGYLQITQSY